MEKIAFERVALNPETNKTTYKLQVPPNSKGGHSLWGERQEVRTILLIMKQDFPSKFVCLFSKLSQLQSFSKERILYPGMK